MFEVANFVRSLYVESVFSVHVSRFLLLIMGVGLPFYSLNLVVLIAALLLLGSAFAFYQGKLSIQLSDFFLLLFFLVSTFSIAWSELPHVTLINFYDVVFASIYYFSIRFWVLADKMALKFYLAGIVGGGLLAGIGRVLAVMPFSSPLVYWLDSSVVDIVIFGSYTALLLPLIFFLYFNSSFFGLCLSFLIFVHWVISVFFFSRMLFLSYVVILIFFVVLCFFSRVVHGLSRFKLLVFFLFFLYSLSFFYVVSIKNQYYGYDSLVFDTFAKTERRIIWSYWVEWFWQYGSWYGWGAGWGVPGGVVTRLHLLPTQYPALWFSHAHNYYLNILFQLGYIGVALVVLFQASLGVAFFRGLRSAELNRKGFSISGLLILAMWITKNFSDDGMRQITLFLALGLLAAFYSGLIRSE